MADYQIVLHDPLGVQLAILDSFSVLDYTRIVNSIGALVITLPPTFDSFLFSGTDVRKDNRIAVYRSISGGQFHLDMETIWFTVFGEKVLTADGQRLTKIRCVDAIELLKRRIVAYNSGSSQADKSATAADNFIKAIVRENLGSLATDTVRDLSAYLTVQADLAQGANVAKAFARRNVLTVCQEVAVASETNGTYVAFDIISGAADALEFRTYTGQRGVDHRYPDGQNPILIGPEYGNLSDVRRGYDHTDEATYIYAGGQGEGASRAIGTASDATRIALSPFNRIERFNDSRLTANATQLADDAAARLRQSEPRATFTGRLIDTPATTYSLHYGFGDFVTAQFENESIDCRIQSIRVKIANGEETIETQLRNDY